MPLELIRNDITAMQVDAIVNAANTRLQRGGGVCGAIFAKADSAALQAACDKIGHVPTGSAAITPSFGLNAPYIIHAVGPVWQDGRHHEEELLRSAYTKSLDLAQENALRSIAFPLISSGIYGYPKREALAAALSAIGGWLMDSESDMTVYLVLFDHTAYELGGALYSRVSAYIDERYVQEHSFARRNITWEQAMQPEDTPSDELCESLMLNAEVPYVDYLGIPLPSERSAPKELPEKKKEALPMESASSALPSAPFHKTRSLEDVLRQAGESFSQMLFRLIDERGLTDPEVYKRANIDRKLFSKIRSNPAYQPGKNTVLALAIALRLNLDQASDLLRRAGYAFSPSSKSDLIIEYCIREGVYSIHEINETLFLFDQKLLGAQ